MAENKALAVINNLIVAKAGVLKAIAPAGTDIQRCVRRAQYLVQSDPKLQACDPRSIMRCVILAARLGLDMEPSRGLFFPVPFGSLAVPVIGYKGYITLLLKTGKYRSVRLNSVHVGDVFEYEEGDNPHIKHVPDLSALRDDTTLLCVYCIAFPKDGGIPEMKVLTKAQTDMTRQRSKAGKSGPWVTDTLAMREKTACLALCRRLPYESDIALAVSVEDMVDSGQSADGVIDAEFSEVEGMNALPEGNAAPPQKQGDALAKKIADKKKNGLTTSDAITPPPTHQPLPGIDPEPISPHRSENADIQLLLDVDELAAKFTDDEYDALKAQFEIGVLAETAPGRLQGLKNAMLTKLAEKKENK